MARSGSLTAINISGG